MKCIHKTLLPLLAAAACLAFALPARALTHAFELRPADAAKIDARDADFPASDLKLVLNRTPDGETPNVDDQSRLLFTVPAELFDAPANRLSRAVLTLSSTGGRNYDGRSLFLHPLAAPFVPAEATWNSRAAETPWTAPGGDFLANAVSAVFSADSAGVAFDVTPLLSDTNAAAALRDNGAIVCFDTETPMDAKFMQLTFAAPASGDDAPALRYALVDPFDDERDFAVSYIDSRDASTVYWEQGEATVGKVVLNGKDGSECRAILTMPESLAAVPPALVQSVVAKFDAEIRDWEGEDIFLAPLATATKLERHPNNETSPVHGPSWNCADASVDTNATSYVLDGQTFDNAPWKVPGGDWMPEFTVRGTVTAPVKGTTGTAKFDLTALWHDDDARAALLANGAIAFLDPDAFPAVQADGRMARVNLYRPDEIVEFTRNAVSWVRVTEYEPFAAGADATPLTAFRIDSASPDTSYVGDRSAKLVMNYRDGSETRAFFTLPEGALDEDLPALDSYTVRFNGGCRDDGDKIPVLLSPVATAFGTTAGIPATWNSAWTNTETGEAAAWTSPGGDWSDFAIAGLYDAATGNLDFNLADLQRNPEAAETALLNGLVMRFDPDQTAVDPEEKGMPRITIGAAGQILRTPKTVATTYIDSASPDANYSAAKKTLVTLNNASAGTEARVLAKLPPSLTGVDLHSAGSVNLLISYFRSWPGDDGVNPVALHPAATAFRLDEATWNNADAATAWQTPGGDYLDAHVTATDSPSQSMLAFDLAPLLADAEAAAALTANGAVIRMLGAPPEAAANNGYNVNGSASASAPAIVLAPAELAVRAIGTDAETGALHFSVAGLDPLRTYVLESIPSLSDPEAEWTVEQAFPPTGELGILPPEGAPAAFYRIRAAD